MADDGGCPECRGLVEVPDDLDRSRVVCLDCGASLEVRHGRLCRSERFRDVADDRPARRGRSRYDEDYDDPRARPRRFDLDDLEDGRRKAWVPSVALQVAGVVLALAAAGACVVGAAVAATVPVNDDDLAVAAVAIVAGVVGLPLGALTWWAGWRMGRMRSRTFVLVVAILLAVFGFLVCPVFVILSVWPLAVLMDEKVKAAFEAEERGWG